MSRHYAPATEGEMDRLMLIAPRDGSTSNRIAIDPSRHCGLTWVDLPPPEPNVAATARPLDDDEDDALTSPRRAATLRRLGVLTLLLALLASCGGSSALQVHARVGTAVNEVAIATRAAVMAERLAVLQAAKVAAQVNGQPVEPAVIAAAKAFDDSSLVRAVDAFIAADHAYALAVQAWIAKDHKDVHVAAALLGVIVAYDKMRDAVGERVKLPALPKQVAELIGGGL